MKIVTSALLKKVILKVYISLHALSMCQTIILLIENFIKKDDKCFWKTSLEILHFIFRNFWHLLPFQVFLLLVCVGGREALIFHVWVKVKRSLNQTWGSSCVAGREAMFEITLNQNKYHHNGQTRPDSTNYYSKLSIIIWARL